MHYTLKTNIKQFMHTNSNAFEFSVCELQYQYRRCSMQKLKIKTKVEKAFPKTIAHKQYCNRKILCVSIN